MGLRKKIFLLYGTAVLTLFVIFTAIQFILVSKGFSNVEREYARTNLYQVRDALEQIIDNVNSKAADWANWDDTYHFVQDGNPSYIKSNLNSETIVNLQIHGILFFDPQMKLIQSSFIDDITGMGTSVPEGLVETLTSNQKLLLEFTAPNQFKAGIIHAGELNAIISSRPIATSRQQGPLKGTIVFVKLINDSVFDKVAAITHLAVTAVPFKNLASYQLPKAAAETLQNDQPVLRIKSLSEMESFILKRDLLGLPSYVMRVVMPRTIFKMAQNSLFYFVVGGICFGFFLVLGSLWIMDRLVLKRTLDLTRQTQRLAHDVKLNERTFLAGEDELSLLAQSFNNLLDAIEKTQKQRLDLEQKLRHSQKMNLIGRLSGGLAHDFNNLLAVIVGYSDLLGESLEPGDPRVEYVKEIRNGCTRANGVIRQLLALGKKQSRQPKVIDLNNAIQETHLMLKQFLEEHILFTLELSPEEIRIEIDPSEFEHVILNLVNNARYAMKTGGECRLAVRQTIFAEEFSNNYFTIPPGLYAQISISDTGTGIPPEVMSHLFEPYFTTKSKSEGSGLGLVMCSSIIDLSKGMIDIQTEIGKGTTVFIYLPITQKPISLENLSTASSPFSQNLKGSQKILIVDDEDGLRKLIKKTFSEKGYKITAASNGAEASAILNSGESFDLLITDIIMPGASGAEIAELYRRKNKNGKVIFISGYTDDMLPPAAILHQKNTLFIPKPFSSQDILKAAQNLLSS